MAGLQFNDYLIDVRHLMDASEFESLDAIYQHCFGDHSVPSQRQKEWWMRANKNILGLFVDDTLVGGASFWSIQNSTFETLKTGQLMERDITLHDFDEIMFDHYYFSDLAIADPHRKKQLSNTLLLKMFEQIANIVVASRELSMLAFAYSDSGRKILSRLGFVKILDASETLDEQDLFLLKIQLPSDLVQIQEMLAL